MSDFWSAVSTILAIFLAGFGCFYIGFHEGSKEPVVPEDSQRDLAYWAVSTDTNMLWWTNTFGEREFTGFYCYLKPKEQPVQSKQDVWCVDRNLNEPNGFGTNCSDSFNCPINSKSCYLFTYSNNSGESIKVYRKDWIKLEDNLDANGFLIEKTIGVQSKQDSSLRNSCRGFFIGSESEGKEWSRNCDAECVKWKEPDCNNCLYMKECLCYSDENCAKQDSIEPDGSMSPANPSDLLGSQPDDNNGLLHFYNPSQECNDSVFIGRLEKVWIDLNTGKLYYNNYCSPKVDTNYICRKGSD